MAPPMNENGPEVVVKDGARTLRLVTSLEGYQPGDVIVRPVDNKLLILSSQSEKVVKSYDLPESVDPFVVEATMSADSVLTVEAPLAG